MENFKTEDKIVREFISSLIKSGGSIICMYNARCRDATLRIFLTTDVRFPNNGVFDYTVTGIELTETLKSSNSLMLARESALKSVSDMETVKYKFSSDYSFEWIISI
jgi:hypothetical protein